MNFADYVSRRQCVALLGERGCATTITTLDKWRADAKMGFPIAIPVNARSVVFERAAVLTWIEAFKHSPRFATFRRQQAARWSVEQVKLAMQDNGGLVAFAASLAPAKKQPKKPSRKKASANQSAESAAVEA